MVSSHQLYLERPSIISVSANSKPRRSQHRRSAACRSFAAAGIGVAWIRHLTAKRIVDKALPKDLPKITGHINRRWNIGPFRAVENNGGRSAQGPDAET